MYDTRHSLQHNKTARWPSLHCGKINNVTKQCNHVNNVGVVNALFSSPLMKAMHTLHSVLLATIIFLELIHKLVQFGKLFLLNSNFFFHSCSDHPDHYPQFIALSHDSCIVKIGIFSLLYSCCLLLIPVVEFEHSKPGLSLATRCQSLSLFPNGLPIVWDKPSRYFPNVWDVLKPSCNLFNVQDIQTLSQLA